MPIYINFQINGASGETLKPPNPILLLKIIPDYKNKQYDRVLHIDFQNGGTPNYGFL